MNSITPFKILKAFIPSMNLDIANAIMELNMYESIDEIHIHGTMAVVDNYGLIEDFGLQGDEEIQLEIRTYGDESNRQLTVRLFSIDSVALPANGTGSSVVTLTFVSNDYYKTLGKRYSVHYEGSHTHILTQIFNTIQVNPIVNDESNFATSVIIPNLKFNSTIDFILKRAISSENEYFYVYQTVNSEYIIESMTYMKNKDTYKEYSKRIRDVSPLETQKNSSDRTNILQFEVNNYMSVAEDKLLGYESGTNEVFDMFTRTTKTQHISTDEDPNGAQFYELSISNGEANSNYDSSKLDVFHKVNKQMHATNVLITIPGDFDACAGKTIDLELPTHSVLHVNKPDVNVKISGKYVITGTRHKMTGDAYVTTLDCLRVL